MSTYFFDVIAIFRCNFFAIAVAHYGSSAAKQGAEKGRFLYGGSTIVLLLRKNAAHILPQLLEASARGEELRVRMGQIIGHRC